MTDKELIDKLRNKRETFNPWLAVADEWLPGFENNITQRDYILEDDRGAIEEYEKELNAQIQKESEKSNGKKKVSDRHLKLGVLPQPFIGNPCAPIWVLLKNPGYSSADIYDLKSIRSGKQQLLREGVPQSNILSIQGLSDEDALQKRRELVCNQLKFKFEEDKAFYILRKEFKTVVNDSKETLGGYNWYKKYFCGGTGYFGANCDEEKFSRKLFVLEYVPYHSKQYFASTVEFAHYNLWRELVAYAIEKKVIVVRGEPLLRKIENVVGQNKLDEACKDRRIFVLKGQSAKLSSANTYWPCTKDSKSNPLVRVLLANG